MRYDDDMVNRKGGKTHAIPRPGAARHAMDASFSLRLDIQLPVNLHSCIPHERSSRLLA